MVEEPKIKQSYLEALAAWQKEYDAWKKESDAFFKRHPKPPPSEAMVLWTKEYNDFIKRHPKPPRTEAQQAWNKEYRVFSLRHPFPRKPIPEFVSTSQALVPVSESLVPVSASQSLVPVSDGQAGRDLGFVLPTKPTEINALTQGDETGKQKYICGKTSEVLLLGDSTTLYGGNSRQIIEVDEASPIGSTLGSKRAYMEISSSWNGKLLCLPSNTTYDSDVTVNTKSDFEDALHRKITKTGTSGEYNTAHTSNNFDDDVYEISPPLDQKPAKSRKAKAKGY